MSSSHTPDETDNTATPSDVLPQQTTLTINPSVSTESVDLVQSAPPTPEEQIAAREKALKD
ncbi:hypothetical protein C0991_002868, partial [Blastosporella zonata]